MWNLTRIPFYNPFLGKSIDIFDPIPFGESGVFPHQTLTEVNLYYQPLQNPIIATVYLIIRIVMIFSGEYMQMKVLALFKRDSCMANDVLKMLSYVQMGYWPLFTLFEASTDFVVPLRELIGTWYCQVGFLVMVYGITHIVFHSFVVAFMRYVFIVHNKRVASFGKERAKRLFLWMSFLVPMLTTTWRFVGHLEVSAYSSFNKCNGIHHASFLMENGFGSTAENLFCFMEEYEGEKDFLSLATLKRTLCMLSSIVYVVMGFNVIEGIFYWRTLKHTKR